MAIGAARKYMVYKLTIHWNFVTLLGAFINQPVSCPSVDVTAFKIFLTSKILFLF